MSKERVLVEKADGTRYTMSPDDVHFPGKVDLVTRGLAIGAIIFSGIAAVKSFIPESQELQASTTGISPSVRRELNALKATDESNLLADCIQEDILRTLYQAPNLEHGECEGEREGWITDEEARNHYLGEGEDE